MRILRNIIFGVFELFFSLFLPRKIKRVGPIRDKTGLIANVATRAISHRDSCPEQLSRNVSALLPYQHPEIKRVLWDFKYYLRPDATEFCANIIFDELVANMSDRVGDMYLSQDKIARKDVTQSSVAQSGPVQSGPRIVIHCPSSTYFKGEKKFDHMRELLVKIEQWQNSEFPFFVAGLHAILPNNGSTSGSNSESCKNSTENSKDMKAQHFGNRKERFAWAKDRFRLSEEFIKFFSRNGEFETRAIQGAPYYIYCIDDVTTTSASFKAISEHIQKELSMPVKCLAIAH